MAVLIKRSAGHCFQLAMLACGLFPAAVPLHATPSSAAVIAVHVTTPLIDGGSESASPGDTINIVGASFDSTCQVWLLVNGATLLQCQVVAASRNIIQAAIPANAPTGLYTVCVRKSSSSGKTISIPYGATKNGTLTLNAPRPVACETPGVSPGGTLRLWGRNMTAPGMTAAQCSVTFVSQDDASSHPGVVTAATPYVMTVSAPADLVPGVTYDITVNNMSYAPAARMAPFSVMCQEDAGDPFGLQVPWASDLAPLASQVYNAKTDSADFGAANLCAGDGVTDDRQHLNSEIHWISTHGGGTLYLPAATYYADVASSYIECLPNVALVGDGPGLTTITYGPVAHIIPAAQTPGSYSWLLHIHSNFGAQGITFRNLNPYTDADLQSSDAGTKYSNPFCVQVDAPTDVFFKNCDFAVGNSQYISLQNIAKLAFEDNTIEDSGHASDCADFLGDSYSRWSGNTVNYQSGRIDLRETTNSVFEGNTLARNASSERAVNGEYEFESGGLECSYSQGLLVQGNSISVAQRYPYSNDGESILTQTDPGAQTSYLDAGTVTSATQTTLTDSSKSWDTATNFLTSPTSPITTVVVITGGIGLGQWRTVTGESANTLTLDHPWIVRPEQGSTYEVTVWSGDHLYALGNTLTNNPRGIELFDGSYDCVVADNTLKDSENISLRSGMVGRTASSTVGSVVATMSLHNLVANNSLSNPGGQDFAVCGVMAISQSLPAALGTTSLDNELRNNTIVSSVAPGTYDYDVQALQNATSDGFWVDENTWLLGAAPTYGGSAQGAISGTIFQGNSVANGNLGALSNPTETTYYESPLAQPMMLVLD